MKERNVLALPRGMRLANLEEDDADSAKTPTPTRNRVLMDARTKHDAKLVVELGGGEMHASNLSWAKTLSFLRDLTSMKIVLNILERELSRTMALAGVREISEISSAYLAVGNPTFGVTKL